MSAYCASKSGALSFAQILRAEVAHRGVGVGVADLSWTHTEMIRAGDTFVALRRCGQAPDAGALQCAAAWTATDGIMDLAVPCTAGGLYGV
ncbi:hypothetical protein OG963_00620 [Streptomyces sp. NBC_01707]|uniref:hypothetical protein n=1 Tax=unclassified Streptomyces TaxID=2593676 RepID=UPI002E0D97B9|nr:hypothetical protein OG763_43800 [Streptomyces sp. NBC_01230]